MKDKDKESDYINCQLSNKLNKDEDGPDLINKNGDKQYYIKTLLNL